jgi:hypothetical protein
LQEKLVREHFLAQTPQVLLHEAGPNSMVLVLDVPDLSLVENKVGPDSEGWRGGWACCTARRAGDVKHGVCSWLRPAPWDIDSYSKPGAASMMLVLDVLVLSW